MAGRKGEIPGGGFNDAQPSLPIGDTRIARLDDVASGEGIFGAELLAAHDELADALFRLGGRYRDAKRMPVPGGTLLSGMYEGWLTELGSHSVEDVSLKIFPASVTLPMGSIGKAENSVPYVRLSDTDVIDFATEAIERDVVIVYGRNDDRRMIFQPYGASTIGIFMERIIKSHPDTAYIIAGMEKENILGWNKKIALLKLSIHFSREIPYFYFQELNFRGKQVEVLRVTKAATDLFTRKGQGE